MGDDESRGKSSGGSLKAGTGDDPWDDDEPTDQEMEKERSTDQEPATADTSSTTEPMSTGPDSPVTDTTESDDKTKPTSKQQHNVVDTIPHTDGQYPYLLARNSVSDGRDAATLSLPISAATQKIYNRGIFQLDNERFEDADIQNTDVAIASLLVGLKHLDEVEEILRDWGYGIEK